MELSETPQSEKTGPEQKLSLQETRMPAETTAIGATNPSGGSGRGHAGGGHSHQHSEGDDADQEELNRSILRVGSFVFGSGAGGSARRQHSSNSKSNNRHRASNYNHVQAAVMHNLSENSELGHSLIPNGVVGLSNMGNTCFLNSSLQCLSNTIPLTDYFLGYDFRSEINKDNFLGSGGKLVLAYAELMKQMWLNTQKDGSQVLSLAPRQFKSKLVRFAPQFSGSQQHDAHELLAVLLDGIHEDLNRVKSKPYIEDKDCDGTADEEDAIKAWKNYLRRNKSLIVDLFQGQLKNTCQCRTCGFRNIRFEPFMYLSLPVGKKSKSLHNCLELYLQTEDLDGNNQWYCPKCKRHVDATKKIDLWVLPPILIIHLKRFRFNSRGGRSKNSQALHYPIEDWDLSQSVKSKGGEYPLFDLYAVSNHLGGGLGSGHYTAYALNRLNDQWYEFNDSRFQPIDPERELQDSASPYLLFYNRSDKKDATGGSLRSSKLQGPASGPLVQRQSLSRPELWPHMQVMDAHFRDYSRSSSRKFNADESSYISSNASIMNLLSVSEDNDDKKDDQEEEEDLFASL